MRNSLIKEVPNTPCHPGAGSSIWRWALGAAVQFGRIAWNMGPRWTASYLVGLSLASRCLRSAGRAAVERFFAAVAADQEPIWADVFEDPKPKGIGYRPLGGAAARVVVTPGEWWAEHRRGGGGRSATILRAEEATIRGGGRLFSSTFTVVSPEYDGGERTGFARFEISDKSERGKISRVDFFW